MRAEAHGFLEGAGWCAATLLRAAATTRAHVADLPRDPKRTEPNSDELSVIKNHEAAAKMLETLAETLISSAKEEASSRYPEFDPLPKPTKRPNLGY